MGTVLAMKLQRILKSLATVALLTLAGCGNAPVDDSSNAFFLGAIKEIQAKIAARNTPPFSLTRAQLAQVQVPVLWIEVEKNGSVGSAIPIGVNRDLITWTTANAATLLTKDGVLFGTRGLGPDLLTAETEALRAALATRSSARYERKFRFIGGDESLRVDRYFCELENDGAAVREVLELRFETTQMRETCFALNSEHEFRNIYWIGAEGTIWDSRQWVSPDAGSLIIQRLVR